MFALFLAVATLTAARQQASAPPVGAPAAPAAPASQGAEVASAEEVNVRCSVWHRLPPPYILPRAGWRDELVRRMLIQEGIPEPAGGNAMIPLPPEWIRVLRYFEAHAPEHLPEPESWPAADATQPRQFER